jgi:hypothetical protein
MSGYLENILDTQASSENESKRIYRNIANQDTSLHCFRDLSVIYG